MRILPVQNNYIYGQKTTSSKNVSSPVINQPGFKGYKEVFQEAFCQKFTKKFQAEQAYDKLVNTAISEFKNFPVSLYLLSKGRNLAIELGNYTNNQETRKLADEKVYHNNNLVVLGGAIGVHFYDPEDSKRWVSFYSNDSYLELDVMQMHEYGYDNYLFWHSDRGNLKKYIHNSGNNTETTNYNLDGSRQSLTDRFKNFFGF